MSTFDNQSMSIGCVSKLGHLFGLLRHFIPLKGKFMNFMGATKTDEVKLKRNSFLLLHVYETVPWCLRCDGPYVTFSYTYVHSPKTSKLGIYFVQEASKILSILRVLGNECMCMKMSCMVHRT